MDIRRIGLHNPNMTTIRSKIPSYRLFGEHQDDPADFWLHCEPIPERTHLHNWEIALHRHEQFFQLFLLPQGSGEIVSQTGILPFTAPVILFIPPDAGHGFRFTRDIDGLVVTALADRLRSLAAADREIARFAEKLRIVTLTGKDGGRAAEAIERIDAELSGRAIGRTLLLEPLMTQALVALTRASRPGDRQQEQSRDLARIEELLTIVDTHFRRRLPITFYSERLGVSAAHLNRITRSATGLSIQNLIDRRTLEAARRDLIFTPTPISKIAYSLGFADPAYFNRFFRKQTGLTPGAFRDRERRRLAD
ncbi:helix-turn-helix domain-containing protein [Mesorhizobium sp. YIM 152430]|nr:helix-turn-helix domain-containing protein [Mesorhizobium sp. YIM 152430]